MNGSGSGASRASAPCAIKIYSLLLAGLLAACSPAVQDSPAANATAVAAPVSMVPDLARVEPETVGVDSARLAAVTVRMQEFVDAGQLSGVVTMAARHGKLVHESAVGYRDVATGEPMETSDIFRIYSMTKPITGVAMMILYEEGKFRLSDPVEKYIPEFKDLQVAAGTDADGKIITEKANHPMTIRELMSHTGGLTYGIFSQSAVDSLYTDMNMLDSNSTLQDMIDKLAQIPLRQQPGSLWHYSVSVDVQGYLVEKLSGMKFGDFLEQRIFAPLQMNDTDFYVTAEKADRFAQVYSYTAEGDLVAQEGFADANFLVNPNFQSGGGGLVSTASDYMKFAQMVANGGELNGVRILSPMTVAMMSRNQMPAGMPHNVLGARGTSFGLDFAIIENPVEAENYSAGEFYWGGAAGTWFWIDPVEEVVFVGMIQQFAGNGHAVPNVRGASRQAFYSAITEPAQ